MAEKYGLFLVLIIVVVEIVFILYTDLFTRKVNRDAAVCYNNSLMTNVVPTNILPSNETEFSRKAIIGKKSTTISLAKNKQLISETGDDPTNHSIPKCPKLFKGDENICQNSPNLTYFLYIHSSPENLIRRNYLRNTWAHSRFFKHNKMKVVFVFGRPLKQELQLQLDLESQQHQDILQGDFVDSYRNLTLKAIFALGFISKYCSHIKYILKTDDDTFLNLFKVLDVLHRNEQEWKSLLICPLYRASKIERLHSKWSVDGGEFPGEKVYPPYCSGHFFLATSDVIKSMLEESQSTRFFWIDDVYITGLLVQKLKKKMVFKTVSILDHYTMNSLKFKNWYADTSKPLTYYVTHVDNIELYPKLWEVMMNRLTTKEKSQINLT